jgi:soluble lytic murein transglycosylase-like protein
MIVFILLLFSSNLHAKDVAQTIDKHSRNFNVDKRLVEAIIQVESGGDQYAVSTTHDYGIMQINVATAKHFKFDLAKIKKDRDYAIYCGVLYLSYLRSKYSSKDKYWWARYHSNTPKYKIKYIRRILNAYNIKGKEATPGRYYSQERNTASIWTGPTFPNRPLAFTKAN